MKCRKLPNGKWECYAEGPRDTITNKRNAVRKQSDKKSVAMQKVKTALSKLESGIDDKLANNVLFSELAKQWLEAYRLTGVKNNTMLSRNSSIKLLNKYIGHLAIGRITHQTIQDVLTDLFREKKSKSTMVHARVAANFIFEHAIKLKLRSDNPVKNTIVPRKRQTVEEIENTELKEKFFEQHELEQFLAATKTHGLVHDQDWFLLLAFTGMRVGELCALRWSDISFEDKTLRITKTMENIQDYRSYQVTPPKTLDSIRTIDIDDNIISALRSVKRKQSENKMKYQLQTDDYHDQNFVFTRPKDGYPYSPRHIYRRSIRLCKKAGLSKIEGPHILRHTHVTMLTEAGVELHIIMERVGHVNAQTTRNIYTHVSSKKKKEAANLLENRYGEIFKSYSGS